MYIKEMTRLAPGRVLQQVLDGLLSLIDPLHGHLPRDFCGGDDVLREHPLGDIPDLVRHDVHTLGDDVQALLSDPCDEVQALAGDGDSRLSDSSDTCKNANTEE